MRLGTLAHPHKGASFATAVFLLSTLGIGPLFAWAVAGEHWIICIGLSLVPLVPVILRWPVITTVGVYAFLATSLDALPLLPGGSTLTKPIGLLTAVTLMAVGLVQRRLAPPPWAALWWLMFGVWASISAAWALVPENALQGLRNPLSLIMLYLVTVCFKPSRRELSSVLALTVLGGVLAASLAYGFGFNKSADREGARGNVQIGDTTSNPNALGRLLNLPMALAIVAVIKSRNNIQRALAIGCVGVMSLGILISMSRGALVGLIVTIAVIAYRVRARWQIIAIAIVIAALATTMPDKFYKRMGSVVSGEDDTASGRTEIWGVALEAFHRYGVMGVGLANFPEAYRLTTITAQRGRAAHSLYLLVLVELGVIGLALLLGACVSALTSIWGAQKAGRGGLALVALEGACFGVLTLGLVGDQIWSKSFWLVWALTAWCTRIDATQEPNTVRPFAASPRATVG